MAVMFKFPDRAARRAARQEAARKPRRSKNGTPEERAAAKANGPFRKVPFKQRRSKNGTPEERSGKQAAQATAGPVDLGPVRIERVRSRLRQRAEMLSLLIDGPQKRRGRPRTIGPKIIGPAPIEAPDFPTEPKAS
jgi:hypothetical protein